MTLGANQIAAYAADLLDTEEDIEALQLAKRDLYKTIREEHGRVAADAIKNAIRLCRMDAEKRDHIEATDVETARVFEIIFASRAGAPARTRENIEQFPSENAVEPVALPVDSGPSDDAASIPRQDGATIPSGDDLALLMRDTDAKSGRPTAQQNALKIRPWCLHSDDLSKCGGQGRIHCHTCLKAHADAEGEAA